MVSGMRSKEGNLQSSSKETNLILRKLLGRKYTNNLQLFSLFEAAMDSVVKDKGITRHFIA